MAETSQWKIFFILAIIVVFGLFLRLVFFSGIDASDGLMNTKYAYDISNSIFPTSTNQANSRIGILVPVSLLYSAFGVNDTTSTIIVLVTSLFGIILIYFFGKLMFNWKVGLLAAFMLSFFPLDVINSTKFLSDLPSAFFTALSVFLFLKAEKNKSGKGNLLYALSGLSLGIGFAIREMAILLVLFFIIYVVYNRKIKLGYFLVMAGFFAILSLEMAFFYNHTGNIFHRFSSLNSNYLDDILRNNIYGRTSPLIFLLAWPYVIFGNIQLGYFYSFISLALLYWLLNRRRETNYLVIWILSILLYLSFGSSSATKYVPFLAVARYLSYCTMPGILLLSAFLMNENNTLKKFIPSFVITFLFFTSIGSIYLDKSHLGLDYLREAYSYVRESDKPVYADYRSKFVFEYFSDYKSKLKLIELESDPENIKNIKGAYVIINYKMIKDRKAAGDDRLQFVSFIKEIPGTWIKSKEIGIIDDEKIVIYNAK